MSFFLSQGEELQIPELTTEGRTTLLLRTRNRRAEGNEMRGARFLSLLRQQDPATSKLFQTIVDRRNQKVRKLVGSATGSSRRSGEFSLVERFVLPCSTTKEKSYRWWIFIGYVATIQSSKQRCIHTTLWNWTTGSYHASRTISFSLLLSPSS